MQLAPDRQVSARVFFLPFSSSPIWIFFPTNCFCGTERIRQRRQLPFSLPFFFPLFSPHDPPFSFSVHRRPSKQKGFRHDSGDVSQVAAACLLLFFLFSLLSFFKFLPLSSERDPKQLYEGWWATGSDPPDAFLLFSSPSPLFRVYLFDRIKIARDDGEDRPARGFFPPSLLLSLPSGNGGGSQNRMGGACRLSPFFSPFFSFFIPFFVLILLLFFLKTRAF